MTDTNVTTPASPPDERANELAGLTPPANRGAALRANIALFAEALSVHGITEVTATYAGSGDSGDTFDVGVSPSGAELPTGTVCLWRMGYGGEVEPEAMPYEAAVEYLTDLAIDVTGHSGYENNSGGGGDFVVDVRASAARLDHYDIVEAHEDHSTTFSGDAEIVAQHEAQRRERERAALTAIAA
jgi:hypothetical protein